MKNYSLIVMAFDGNYKVERDGFKDIQSAWEHSEDMGSRWYFYPFHFILSGNTVRDTPWGLDKFKGRKLATVRKIFKALSDMPDMQNADAETFGLTLATMEIEK